jgi:two-component sensor histidine kinase
VTDEEPGWLGARFANLSTGLKMLLVLSLALLPLGLVAILASLQSARENAAQRAEDMQARVELKAQRIDTALSRSVVAIRAASAAIALAPATSAACRTTVQRLARAHAANDHYALFSGGRLRCATPGFQVAGPLPAFRGHRSEVAIAPDGQSLRFALFDDTGALEGIGTFTARELAELAQLPGTNPAYDLVLSDGPRRMVLRNGFEDGPLVGVIDAVAPVVGNRFRLSIHAGAVPISATELLMILLPVMMWIGAGLIGWLIVDRLLLRPLARMQKAVAAYRPGDRQLDLPTLQTPAREIADLGRAFNQVTRTVAQHEADLEAAVERQSRLVREVHHRVKNNLQVVASLLNLHARGATSEDVAAAYASIQRRVDALAVVHRNHYAELEENRGVALRSLISELAANLRGTAPASAAGMQIRIDIEPYYVTQDVAVSVAFLITEIVEYAMFCGAHHVAVSLAGQEGAKTALLAIESQSLTGEVVCDERLSERFERIVTGLSRQLRSTLVRDLEAGRYALDVTVVEKGER